MHLNFGAMHTASISGVSMNSRGGSICLCYFHFANMYFLDCFFFIILSDVFSYILELSS